MSWSPPFLWESKRFALTSVTSLTAYKTPEGE